MKNPVYVVTAGEYSDFHIVAIYVSERRAKMRAKREWGSRHYRKDEVEVELWDADTGNRVIDYDHA